VSLRARVLSGFRWTASVRLISQLITWAITIVVIRLLSPADYGLLAMATVFVALLSMFSDLGLGQALVQSAEVSDATLRRVFAAVIVIHAVLAVVLALAAPLIAAFFGEPAVTPVVQVLSVQFVIAAFGVIPDALLQRRMEFRRRSLVELTAAVAGALSTLALALLGKGVWALVAGSVATQLIRVAGLNMAAPSVPRPEFSMLGVRAYFRFGGHITLTQLLWFVTTQADVFIAGRWLGKEAVGVYSTAMHLASLPSQRISGLINQLAFPAFSRMQDDRRRVGANTVLGMRILALIGFPVFWGISSIAPEIVGVILGAKWLAAIVPLQLVSIVMPIRLLAYFVPTAVQGLGRSDVLLGNAIATAGIMLVAFPVGVQWGLLGLSLAWVVGAPLVFAISMSRSLPVLGKSWSELVAALAPSAGAGCLMYFAVALARELFAAQGASLLAILICVGVVSYSTTTWFLNRHGCLEALHLVRSLVAFRASETST